MEKYKETNLGVDRVEKLASNWKLIDENVEKVEKMMMEEAELLETQNYTPRPKIVENVTVETTKPYPAQPSRPIYQIINPRTHSDFPNYNPRHRGPPEEPEQVMLRPNVVKNVTVPGAPTPIQPSCPNYEIANPRTLSDCPNYLPSHRGSPEEQTPRINVISGDPREEIAIISKDTEIYRHSCQPKKVEEPPRIKPAVSVTVSKPTNNHTVRHPTEIVIRREPTSNGEGRL